MIDGVTKITGSPSKGFSDRPHGTGREKEEEEEVETLDEEEQIQEAA